MNTIVIFSFFVLFASILLGSYCFLFLTQRGRKILYGGRVTKTFEKLSYKRKFIRSNITVHAVERSPFSRGVGLQVSGHFFLASAAVPVSLSEREALALADLLREAVECQRNVKT